MNELNKKLSAIQQELKAPKSQFNKFGNYNYRSCEDILESAKPLLGDCTLVIYDEIVSVGDRYYVKATATLSDGENSIDAIAYAREALSKKGMDESQITGSASSYARKYALNGLFAIDDTKDADTRDNSNGDNGTESKSTSSTASSAQVGKIGVLANKELGWSNLKVSMLSKKLFKESSVTKLTKAQASKLIEILQAELDKEGANES